MIPLVRATGLAKRFRLRATRGQARDLWAVRDVNLSIERGECLGLCGESGCGKSTLGRLLLRLLAPSAGQAYFDGMDLAGLGSRELRRLRPRMQIIFQDPAAALNPRQRVRSILSEPLQVHEQARGPALARRVEALLDEVHLGVELLDRYPHELSGGERQRLVIARALSLGPQFVVADEPVSMLDVPIQAQMVELLMALGRRRGLTYLFVAHDLGLLARLSDRIAVMRDGQIIDVAAAQAICQGGAHPYTHSLWAASQEAR